MNAKLDSHQDHIDKVKLLEWMEPAFNLGDLRTLCFYLGIDYENITGENKHAKIRELIMHCARLGLLGKLLGRCQEMRERINWHDCIVTVTTTTLHSKPETLEDEPKIALKSVPKPEIKSEETRNQSKRIEPKAKPTQNLAQPKYPPDASEAIADEVFTVFESLILSIAFTAGWMIVGGLTGAFFWDNVWVTLICIAIGASVGLLQLAINWGSVSLIEGLKPFVEATIWGASSGFFISMVSGVIWGMVVAELPEFTLTAFWEATKVTFSTALQVIVGGTVLGAVAFPIGMILVFGLFVQIEEKVSSKYKS